MALLPSPVASMPGVQEQQNQSVATHLKPRLIASLTCQAALMDWTLDCSLGEQLSNCFLAIRRSGRLSMSMSMNSCNSAIDDVVESSIKLLAPQ